MKKVVTYGTFDLLHYGHRRLLERAKALGDYLIVGVTADNFDKTRGKINVQQSLIERIENVKLTGLADEIIVEEYEGQKIDDILKYGADIFAIGSDWEGTFDYLRQYCRVVYLSRTEGVSSSEIRKGERNVRVAIQADITSCQKFVNESEHVNGIEIVNDCGKPDAYYIADQSHTCYESIKLALNNGKHVLCSPLITLNKEQCAALFDIATKNNLILMNGIQVAYSIAYQRLLLLVKSGKIGKILSVDLTCTEDMHGDEDSALGSLSIWGPTALLPVFQLLGINYIDKTITTWIIDKRLKIDGFTKIDFVYKNGTASVKVGKAVKSEGELIITGTKGYIYVPAPWWKTDYFEVRHEDTAENQRYFYHLGGEGMRYEIAAFKKAIQDKQATLHVTEEVSKAICGVMDDFSAGKVNYLE
ncbi:MAG: adenylyltransferase/cytidyltransferase family protein [Aerococcaceae bacterium]|nr:adenylyltransferase/cytidyltransferase family protein [Aerococcaceae bacterium]